MRGGKKEHLDREKKLSSFCSLKMKSSMILKFGYTVVISVKNWNPVCLGHPIHESED